LASVEVISYGTYQIRTGHTSSILLSRKASQPYPGMRRESGPHQPLPPIFRVFLLPLIISPSELPFFLFCLLGLLSPPLLLEGFPLFSIPNFSDIQLILPVVTLPFEKFLTSKSAFFLFLGFFLVCALVPDSSI